MAQSREHNISVDVAKIIGEEGENIGKRGLNGIQVSEPARSRDPIRKAIETIADDSADTMAALRDRVDDNLATISDYSSTFRVATEILNDELKNRARDASIRDSAVKSADKLRSPRTSYAADGTTPSLSWVEDEGEWVLRTPKWPTFQQINVHRLNAVLGTDEKGTAYSEFADSVTYYPSGDKTGFAEVNLMDWFSNINLSAYRVAAYENVYPTDSNGVYIDGTTKEPKNSMALNEKSYAYNLNGRPVLSIPIPQGLVGDDKTQIQFRPFFTDKVWTNGNVASGMPSNYRVGQRLDSYANGHVSIVGNEDPKKPMAGAIIVFQKCAFRENSSRAKSDKNKTALATVFVDDTDTVVFSDNWDWYKQTAIYLPRGSHATACLTMANGDRFLQDVAWGSRPSIDSAYYDDHVYSRVSDDYDVGGFVFSGGRYISANGKTKLGYMFSHEKAWNSGLSYGARTSNFIGIYNTWSHSQQINIGTKSYNNFSAKDYCVARYFMVPVKIIGVFSRLTYDQAEELRK